MSKRIDAAKKELIRALREHASVAGDRSRSVKKSQRATSRVSAAAREYAEAVYAKTGMQNPFSEVVGSGLEQATITSLGAERDHLADKRTASGDDRVQKAS